MRPFAERLSPGFPLRGPSVKLRLTNHVIVRYQERVKPALLRRQARDKLEAIIAAAGDLGPRPDWLPVKHHHSEARYVELVDGTVGVVSKGRVTTIIVRASYQPKERAEKKAARQASQRPRAGRSGKRNRRARGQGSDLWEDEAA